MGNLAANCNVCASSKEEENVEIINPIKGIDEPDPTIREELIQAKLKLEKKIEKNGKFLKSQKITDILNSIKHEKILSVSRNFSLQQTKDVVSQEFFKMKYLQKNAKRIAKILSNKKN